MKILICGATGFMGRNLFEYFSQDPNNIVYGTSFKRDPYHENIIPTNLKDENQVKMLFDMIRPDVVIQAAATTTGAKDIVARPYIHVTDNVIMNTFILRAAFEHKVKHFLFLSCSVMYQESDIPLKESDWNEGDEILPVYYGVGSMKVYIEKQCRFYSRLGMKCTAIRHSNTFGPYDKFDPDHSHILSNKIREIMETPEYGNIVVWGSGEGAKDLIYVDDVVHAIDILIRKQTDPFELVNVSSGIATTINDLVRKIIDASGKTLTQTNDLSKPNIPVKLVYDSTYMKEKYGWIPEVPFSIGLQRTIEWFKHNYKSGN